jgi:hypothetical protein
VQQSAAALRQEQQAFVLNLEEATNRSIKRAFAYLAAGAFIVVALVMGAMIFYRRLGRRAALATAIEDGQNGESAGGDSSVQHAAFRNRP